jgi:casein kinase I family protein HRR25
MVEPGTRIFEKYVLEDCIGSGAFGEVWSARSIITGEMVAVKMERIKNNPVPTLNYEARVLQGLKGTIGIPGLRYFGRREEMDRIFMVFDLLGMSLETLANSHRFDVNCSTMKNPDPRHAEFITRIGRQMLRRLRSLHTLGLIHRDVKPDNFLFARTPILDLSRRAMHTNQEPSSIPCLYLIDFGMAKRIKTFGEEKDPPRASGSLVGSARYASIASHEGAPLGRKDDLISMMYSLIYLANGGALPWMSYTNDEIYYIKNNTTPSELCNELSEHHKDGWTRILELLYAAKTNEIPNYNEIERCL